MLAQSLRGVAVSTAPVRARHLRRGRGDRGVTTGGMARPGGPEVSPGGGGVARILAKPNLPPGVRMRPPRVVVAYASRHEASAEIAAAIAGELGAAGCVTDVGEARAVASLVGVDAAIVGSALYLGRWDDSALDLLRRERAALARIPTWLFSSGPVGDGKATARPARLPQPEEVAALAGEIGAHVTTFGGRVSPDDDAFDLRIMASAGLAGDWRDFDRIRAWARAIAADVRARAVAADA
jgi:menaquinone-dependent protoporphyrinogen oxidase